MSHKLDQTTIEIFGETVELFFNQTAIDQVCAKEKTRPFYVDTIVDGVKMKGYSEIAIAHMIYAGYCNACYAEDKEPYYEFEDLLEVTEELWQTDKLQLTAIVRCFEETLLRRYEAAKTLNNKS